MPDPRREGHSKEMTDRIRDKLRCLFLIRFFALSGLLQEDEKMDFLNGRIKTIYFQALMKPKTAFLASVARGLVISGVLIYLLPVVFGGNAVWSAMPVTELIVAAYVIHEMIKYTRQLGTYQK